MNDAARLSAAATAPVGAAPRRLTIAAATAFAAIGLAATSGCSTPPHTTAGPAVTASAAATAAQATASPSTVSPAPPSVASSPSAPAAPAAPPAPAGPAPCPTRYLGAKVGISQGTAGSTYQVIDFTNIGNVTCPLYGYPGVSLAGGMPVSQIGLAAAENPATPRELVTLAPGAVANALVQIVHAANYPASKCGPVTATYLVIYPPNQTTPIPLAYGSPTCSKPVQILTVDAVRPGSGG